MKRVFKPMLLTTLASVAVLAQNTTSGNESYHLAGTSSEYTLTRTGGYVRTFDAGKTFTSRAYGNATAPGLSLLHSLLHPDYGQTASLGSAAFRPVMPFSYTSAENRSDYFPIRLGPIRYTVWPRVPQSAKPAGGWLQSIIDGILGHYTSDPVVPVNKRCLRALSCNSLYEQALRRRAAP